MFAVVWNRQVLEDTQAIRAQSSEEFFQVVREALRVIETKLRDDPFSESESRDDNRRIMFSVPLGAIFRVDNRQQLVNVTRIWCDRKSE